MITKKDFNTLKKYESYIMQAYNFNCMHSLSHSAQDELYDIYESATGIKKHRNYSCSRCQINIARECAKLYLEYKNSQEIK